MLNVYAIVLAAGASSRMGTSKMALEWGNSTVLETTLGHVSGSHLAGVLLVTGGYRDAVERLPLVMKTTKAHNENYAAGEMISSIKLALSHVRKLCDRPDGVLVIPGDMPLVTAAIINQVIVTWGQTPEQILAPFHAGQRGHPVIFPIDIFEKFDQLPADAAPRDLIKAHKHLFQPLKIDDPAVLIDVDTPAEYAKHRPVQ